LIAEFPNRAPIVRHCCSAVALLFALSLPVSEGLAQTVPAFPKGAEAAESRLLTKVGTQTRAAIKREAVKQTFDSAQAAKVVQSNTGRSNLSSGDIEISDTQSTLTQNLK
jgi:hypothetical protein